MRIAIYAQGFRPAGTGGTETYFRNLIKGLQVVDTQNEYVVFVNKTLGSELRLYKNNFKVQELPKEPFICKLLKRLGVDVWQYILARKINHYHFDIIHYPFQIIDNKYLRGKKVVTSMDIQQEFFPEFFTKEELDFRNKTYKEAFFSSERVVAISDFTKHTLIDRFHVPSEKIVAIPIGYNEDLYDGCRRSRPTYLPKGNYFFYPAATWPHKNHLRLLEAFSDFTLDQTKFSLVLTGISMQGTNQIKQRIEDLGLQEKVYLLGYVPYEDLPAIYQHAFALVYPSLFEGFGIPILEAMACGCPVVAANTSSIPEAAGSAAIYFDPANTRSIVLAMQNISNDGGKRRELIKKGSKRLQAFTSDKMAKKTLETYMEVLSR